MLYWVLLFCFVGLFDVRSEIIVKGNKLVPTDKIQSMIDQIFDLNEAEETLYESGLFELVKIYKKNADYIVEVEEKNIISNIVFFVDGDKKSKNDLGTTYENLIQVSELKPGTVIDSQQIALAKNKIRNYFNVNNYLNTRITSKIIKKDEIYQLQFSINRMDKYSIDEINFVGLKKLPAITLSKQCNHRQKNYILFTTSSPEPFSLAQDVQNMLEYARNEGFLQAQIKDMYVETDDIDNELKQKIYVIFEEGPCFSIGKVQLVTDPSLNKLENFEELSGTANEYRIEAYAARIEKTYKDMGEYVSVSFSKEFHDDKVDLSFDIKRISNRYVASKIIVKGNTVTRTNVILNAAKISVGSYFDHKKLNQIESRIMNLGFFKFANINFYPDKEEGSYIIVITVEETPTGEIGLSGSLQFDGRDSKFLINLFYQHPNFLGTGNEILFNISTGQGTDTFNFGYKIPNIFNTDITWFANAYYHSSSEGQSVIKIRKIEQEIDKKHKNSIKYIYSENEHSNNEHNKNRITVGKRLNHDIGTSVGYTLKTVGVTTGLGFDLFSFGTLKTILSIDNHKYMSTGFMQEQNVSRFFDNNHFPYKRTLIDLSLNYGIGKAFHTKQTINFSNNLSFSFDEKTNFMKIMPSVKFRYPINRSHSIYITANAAYGFMMPFSEYYYWVDHFDSVHVRGFTELGPVERNRYTHIGGTQKFNASIELVMPFFVPTRMLTSFMGVYCGSLWDTAMQDGVILRQYADHRQWKYDTPDIGSKDFLLRASASAGLRFNIGPVKLEWSWNYIFNQNKETDDVKSFQFRLTM